MTPQELHIVYAYYRHKTTMTGTAAQFKCSTSLHNVKHFCMFKTGNFVVSCRMNIESRGKFYRHSWYGSASAKKQGFLFPIYQHPRNSCNLWGIFLLHSTNCRLEWKWCTWIPAQLACVLACTDSHIQFLNVLTWCLGPRSFLIEGTDCQFLWNLFSLAQQCAYWSEYLITEW